MALGREGSTLVEELNRLAFGGTLPAKTQWLDDKVQPISWLVLQVLLLLVLVISMLV